jgi:polyisoprenoid-binding protein YceI
MTATVAPPRFAPGRWRPAPTGVRTAFAVRDFGRFVTGTVPVAEAWVDVSAAGRPAQVHAVLDLRAIDTGNARRDRDLQKPSLLHTAEHPMLLFTGQPERSDDGWTVTGTLAGRSAATVTLAVDVTATGPQEVTVRGTTVVDRRALGVRAPRVLIGHWLRITVEGTFTAPLP